MTVFAHPSSKTVRSTFGQEQSVKCLRIIFDKYLRVIFVCGQLFYIFRLQVYEQVADAIREGDGRLYTRALCVSATSVYNLIQESTVQHQS